MKQSKLIWNDGERSTRASFSIPHLGELNIEVDSQLPGSAQQTVEERKALALRHARLLIRNLANELDRQPV